MDIDLIPKTNLKLEQQTCPWNKADGVQIHKYAIKDTSICRYFRGFKHLDIILCLCPDDV